jgi:hypothetical protein
MKDKVDFFADSKRSAFFNKYASKWTHLTKQDGLECYYEWIEGPKIVFDKVLQALDILGKTWKKDARPRLPVIQQKYYELVKEDYMNELSHDDCNYCSNGYCYMFWSHSHQCYVKFPTDEVLKEELFPCRCGKGKRVWIKSYRERFDRNKITKWHESGYVMGHEEAKHFKAECNKRLMKDRKVHNSLQMKNEELTTEVTNGTIRDCLQ